MEEEFEFDFNDDAQHSVERYEEMIRNQDQYFFDAQAFEYIIDNYIEKNDPVKALQVVEYALNQHPYAAVFLIKQAQLLLFTNQVDKAFSALEKAEMLEASEPDIYVLRGNIYQNLDRHAEALENFEKALTLAETTDEILLQMAYVYQNMHDYETAIVYIKRSL
ncbi:MAG: tetratricopeptide repeat protein, partial [Pedobacter sp.]